MIKINYLVKVEDWEGIKNSVLTKDRLEGIKKVFGGDAEAKIIKVFPNGGAWAENNRGKCFFAVREIPFLKMVDNSPRLLKDIHQCHKKYLSAIKELENDLAPYLCEYLKGDEPHIFIREDEGGRLFIAEGINNYELNEAHINFIKKYGKLNK